MKRAILAALIALLIAAPAVADVAVIVYGTPTAATHANDVYWASLVKRHFYKYGVRCDVFNDMAVKGQSSLVRSGLVCGKTYDLVVICGFAAGASTNIGFFADSLTQLKYFNTVPIIFLGRVATGNQFTQGGAAACSTGLSANWLATVDMDSTHSAWLVSGPEVWKERTQRPFIENANKPPGLYRAIVAYGLGASLLSNNEAFGGLNPDAAITRELYPDTLLVAMRDMSSLGDLTAQGGTWGLNYTTAKPQWYVSCGNNNYNNGIENFVIAAAHADSFTNGAIYSNKSRIPQRMVFLIRSAFRHGYTFNSNEGIHAVRLAQGDTVSLKRGLDTLATTKAKFTVTYEPDSLADLFYQRAWFDRLGAVRYMPYVTMGCATGYPSLAGLASVTTPRDPFGKQRTRIAWGGGDATGADTGSVWFNVMSAIQMGKNFFGASNVEPSIMACADDISPSNFSTIRDTMYAALADAGVSSIFTNTDNIALNGSQFPYWTPRTVKLELARSDTASKPMRTRVNGRTLTFIPGNAFSTIGPNYSIAVALEYSNNCLHSALMGIKDPGYPASPSSASNLTYDTECLACTNQAAQFGFSDEFGVGGRNGVWSFKWVLNQFNAINRMAGRTIVTSAWPSEIAP